VGRCQEVWDPAEGRSEERSVGTLVEGETFLWYVLTSGEDSMKTRKPRRESQDRYHEYRLLDCIDSCLWRVMGARRVVWVFGLSSVFTRS